MTDKIKLLAAVLMVIAGIAGFYYLADSPSVVRLGAILLGFALGIAIFWFTQTGRQFFAFSQESVVEARKVVWPTRKETIQTTGIVFAFVVVMALFLWLVDAGLLWAVKLLMGQNT
ncbi:MAG: preprotein translocase subunit SecE [Sulfuriferula sp.]|jgi:preprotein translocase subunit SecE